MSLVQWIKNTVSNAGQKKELNGSLKKEKQKKFDPNEPTPELTLEQLELLRDTWQRVQRDVTSVGVITFVRCVTSQKYLIIIYGINFVFDKFTE